ncbi:Putative Mn2+ efflux pump MntP [Malonomonas rubra DSM 5091]|uniref:Putative manganese efflux pump MntP n=1 Tax=Malonomonas rubra DSM 5091 TaxID=1122189 RepID=A0A1M6DX66_MALRU|nr:manganese efflux pump MntP family protein [Malonomonas rubra]SHI77719.1 Putative Mn2+ efflux pump MntP [Malonomonas rubra DSM 5091]
MDIITLFGIAIALAMDAFAVALSAGLILPELTGRHLFRFGFHFGLFQALMPILGWLAGTSIRALIESFDHWLAFGLLVLVGGKMLWEARQDDEENEQPNDPTRGLSLVMLSIATSIDALAVGLSLAILGVTIWTPALVIGLVAGILTVCGMLLGRRLGRAWGTGVEIFGGLVLIAIGVKILVEHTLLQ